MIEYRQLDLLMIECGVVAHGCNCQGVMGAGLAKVLREQYPSIFKEYTTLCTNKSPEELLGRAQMVSVSKNLMIANCFTQLSYGRDKTHAEANAVYDALYSLCDWMKSRREFGTVYLPKIGCGLGGLNWELDVEPRVRSLAEQTGIKFVVCQL